MTKPTVKKWRTVLFVPANKPKYLASALKIKPDAVQLDLEDSVSDAHKQEARTFIKSACQQLKSHGIDTIVRINNAPELYLDDLDASVCEHLDAITIPKLNSIEQLKSVEQALTKLESNLALTNGGIKLLGLIETLSGLRYREGWQHAPSRFAGMALGSEDLCQEIACQPTFDNLLEPCRHVLYAAREAGLNAWGMPISIGEFNDSTALEAAMIRAKQMGMDGVWCIHPSQVTLAKRIFTANEDEMAEAQRIVEAFEQAQSDGEGAISVDGKMIDLPVYQRALSFLNDNS